MSIPGFYFAWVDPGETFGVEHHRKDEDVISFVIDHEEGSIPSLAVKVRNPRVGLLSVGRKRRAFLSWDDGSTVHLVFNGRVVGLPTNVFADIVTIILTARAEDLEDQKQNIAEDLRVLPFFDPLLVDEARRSDPDAAMEAYSAKWHFDRLTNEVTISDIITGEDGTEEFQPTDFPWDSLDVSLSQAPQRRATMDLTVSWTQVSHGYIEMGNKVFGSYSGDGILNEWPRSGAGLQGGYSVAFAGVSDRRRVASALTATWSYSYTNKAKQHSNGDTMSISISVSEPQISADNRNIILTQKIQTGVIDPYAVDDNGDPAPLNIPAETSITKAHVPFWIVSGSMVLRYDTNRPRTERIVFTLEADVQDTINAPTVTEAGELVTMSSTDAGLPIINVLGWRGVRGEAVTEGDVIFPDYPQFPGAKIAQICVQSGVTGTTLPDFSPFAGDLTVDGTAEWASLGTQQINATAKSWSKLATVQLGEVLRPHLGLIITYRAMMQPGLTQSPPTGVPVSEGQIIQSSSGSYHICEISGTTGTRGGGGSYAPGFFSFMPMVSVAVTPVEPGFSPVWGSVTVDGSVVWVGLGTSIPDGAHHYICTTAGTTGEYLPPFNHTDGSVTIDGTVEWTNIGAAEVPVGGVVDNITARTYFPSDRGRLTLEYAILLLRARLLARARAGKVVVRCRFERAIELSLRKNAIVYDGRIPSGQAFGKITSYQIRANETVGLLDGTVTVECAVGRGGTVTAVEGDPVYAEAGYALPGWQQYEGSTVLLPTVGDVGYTPPPVTVQDDGLIFPIRNKEAIILVDRVRGSIDHQEAAIDSALRSMAVAAQLGQIQAESSQTSIALQQAVANLGTDSVSRALQENPVWYELVLKPVTGRSFAHEISVSLTQLVIPQGITLE